MELIKLNLEIPYEKAGAEKPESAAQLVCYLQQPQNMPVPRPAVVICPGGGYRYTSSRESESIAMQYLAAGMQAFVLYYNCAPAVFPCALLELAKSVSIVRSHAAEWNIDPEKILVAGFSAGGHLAASLGCFWNQSFVYEPLGLLAEDIRPNGNILCYPVITSGEFAHRGSFNELCRGLDQEKYLKFTSLEKQAGTQNPPTFIWHTNEDQAVPVENSFLYTAALRKAKVSVEFHMYAHGWHGLSLANEETKCDKDGELPKVQSWMGLSITWIKDLGREY